jgi:hypothetical protein
MAWQVNYSLRDGTECSKCTAGSACILLVAGIKYFVLRLCLTDLRPYRRMEKQLETQILGDPHES